MKTLIKNVAINGLALYAAYQFLDGVKVYGGFWTFVFGGLLLTGMFLILRPILGIITFPLNMVTFGMFSIVTNAFILYLLTVFYPQISVFPFLFHGITFLGFVIPKMYFNQFFAYIATSVVISAVVTIIRWMSQW